MKVAIVEFAGKGGLIHYAFQLARAMRSEGAEVTLLTDRHYELADLPHPFERIHALNLWDPKAGSEQLPRPLRKLRRAARAVRYYREWMRLIAELRRLQADVIQFGDVRFATDLAPLKRVRRRAPVLADICHNVRPFSGGEGSSGTFESSALEQRMFRSIYRQFDAIFVHYDINVDEFSRTFPESASRTTRIVHGNEEIFRELAGETTPGDLRRRLDIPAAAEVVLFFGTLSHYKGVDLLLEAFADVARARERAVLVVAGYPFSDFDLAGFHRRSEELGIAGRVRVLPRYIQSAEIAAWMQLPQVVVFPYRTVFQSGALHVAHTFGAPIVATRVGAMGEVIRDEETGLLIEPDDRAALAAALLRLLLDPSLAARLGAAAANDALQRFSWKGVARTMLDRYEEILTERRAG